MQRLVVLACMCIKQGGTELLVNRLELLSRDPRLTLSRTEPGFFTWETLIG